MTQLEKVDKKWRGDMKSTNTGPNIYKTKKSPYPARIAVFPKQSASQALAHKIPGRHVRVCTDQAQKGKPEEESVCYKNACM